MTIPIEDDSTLPGETPILTQKAPFYLGTLNVRTLAKPGKLELIVKELERYRWDVIGLSETHLPGSGEQRCGDIILSYSGRPDGKHRQGVGFLLTRKAKRALIATKLVSERLMMIRLRAKVQNITAIQVYAPDSSRPDEEVDTFYQQLQSLTDEVPKKDLLVVMGDFNAIAGEATQLDSDVLGRFGLGRRNARGERLLEFCRDNDLFVTNSMFKHRKRRKAPDGKTTNLIDYVLISKRWKSSVTNTTALPGGDFDSDHVLVMSTLAKLRLKTLPVKKNKIPRLRTDKLKEPTTRTTFLQSLEESLGPILESLPSTITPDILDALVEKLNTALIDTAKEILGHKPKTEKPWITDEILDLCDQKRQVCNKQDRESRDMYKRIQRTVNKKIRTALRDYIREKCESCEKDFKSGNNHRMYKTVKELSTKKSTIAASVLDKGGKLLSDSEAIKDRWKSHFEEKLNPCLT